VQGNLLEIVQVSKSYDGVQALREVSLHVAPGEAVGLLGENGAGKSTLLNVLSGVDQPESGRILFRGSEVQIPNYHRANEMGIFRVFQEQALLPNLTVYENLFISHERRFEVCRLALARGQMIRRATDLFGRIGLDLDVRRRVSDLSFAERQGVEIGRAVSLAALLEIRMPLILLDEPTTALDHVEEERFFRLLRQLRGNASVVFVSHRLQESITACDRLYVLKDGELVTSLLPIETTPSDLHALMVGRARSANYYHESEQHHAESKRTILVAEGLTQPGAYYDVSLSLYEGEVLGIGGLQGSGKQELGQGVVGVMPPHDGTVRIGDGSARRPRFRSLIKEGVAYVPAERQVDGLDPAASVLSNIQMASLHDRFTNRLGVWMARLARRTASRFVENLGIKTTGLGAPCNTLSGGNQQKVVLAKWLCREPAVLILDNPTRGVDTGARESIYEVVRVLCDGGAGVILITDDLPELIGLSDRILVMVQGRIADVVESPSDRKPSEKDLVRLMIPLTRLT